MIAFLPSCSCTTNMCNPPGNLAVAKNSGLISDDIFSSFAKSSRYAKQVVHIGLRKDILISKRVQRVAAGTDTGLSHFSHDSPREEYRWNPVLLRNAVPWCLHVAQIEPCRADVPHVLTDDPVKMVPVAGTSTAVLVGRPVARKRTSSKRSTVIGKPPFRKLAPNLERRRGMKEDLAFCFQQLHTRTIHQSVFLGALRMHHPTLLLDPGPLMSAPRDCLKK
ncbi:uncharacterized protein DEA37_0012402 [Paragonimus westermani]|uniref:Uncharacterized protein n=1 Tax=Paragonimus westermani TaxID=34504 RepID=A0A5J4N6U3_9TREM|nr:uncharacterized protein DEA37_0012402 [Paragonimus westermani]